MRHIKYILFLLLFAFVSQLTFAAGAVTLVLKLKDGDAVEKFKLATKPVVTFEDGTSKASEIMHEWYDAIAEANGIQ